MSGSEILIETNDDGDMILGAGVGEVSGAILIPEGSSQDTVDQVLRDLEKEASHSAEVDRHGR